MSDAIAIKPATDREASPKEIAIAGVALVAHTYS